MGDQEILTEIRERLVRVETKIDDMTNVQETANRAEKTANEAYIRARNAHSRIDKIDKAIFWLVTSIIGGIITSILGLIILDLR